MIKYALICEKDHEFESWFPNSDSFETQVKRGFVECPHCGSIKVSKALMAPSVSTSRKREERSEKMREAMAAMPPPPAAAPVPPPLPVPVPAPPPQAMTLLDETQQQLRAAIRELHEKVVANTEDVGAQFPDQARKMHDGELPQRAIRGEATFEEAKELWEEGIPVLPVPPLPDDRN